VAKVLLRK